jgi:hypothetical protein
VTIVFKCTRFGKDWSRFWGDRFWRPDRPSDSSPQGLGNQDDSDEFAESGEQEREENGDREDDRGGGFAMLDDRFQDFGSTDISKSCLWNFEQTGEIFSPAIY